MPTHDVTVSLTSSDTTEGTVTSSLTFTSANWNTDQTVTVTGVDDALIDGDITYSVNLSAASSDTNYNAKTASVSVVNDDNDTASLVLGAISAHTKEAAGGTATFTVKLSSQPTHDVTVSLTSSDTTEGTVTSSLTFTSANWSSAQTVTVTGVDDTQVDGDITYTVSLSTKSSDTNYDAKSASVSVVNDDNDVAPPPAPPSDPTPPPPAPTFTANLDPAKDTGELDNVTKDAQPEFTLNGGTYLQPGRTAQLLDPTGAVIGSSPVTEADVTSGKVNVPTPLLDDGTYTYTAQILDATGKVVATAPVTVTVVTDLDGVMPSVELAANGGDSNGDGLPDWQQNNVAQLPMLSVESYQQGKNAPSDSFGSVIAGSPDPASPGGVKLEESAQLENIRILPLPPEPLPNRAVAKTPLIDFTVTSQKGSSLADLDTGRPGLQLQSVIVLPANVTANAYMKYDRTSGKWSNMTNAASINGSQDGAALIDTNGDGRVDRIVVTITDGGPGDEDGVANGKVVDPGSLALVPPLIQGPSGPEGALSSEKSLPENIQAVYGFTASEPVTWAISGGNDDGLFDIDAQGQLIFRKAPDYETPLDLNKDNDYILQIKATNAQGNSNTQDVTVHVTDVDEVSLTATLDPRFDSGPRDFITNIDKPQFTLTTTALLQTGQTVRLVRPDGSVQAVMPVEAQAVASGTLQLPAGLLDDGRHDFTVQVLSGAGQVLASAPVYVTVITDLDGVPPWIEQVANNGDFNKDGLQDWQQNNVAHLPIMSMAEYLKGLDAAHNSFGAIMAGSPDASKPGGVRLDEGSRLQNVQMSPLPAKPLPTGAVDVTPLFDFKVSVTPGASMADVSPRAGLQTQVVIDLPYGVRADAFLKYDSVQQRWFNFTNPAAASGAQDGAALIDRNGDKLIDRVVLTYTDGAPGDEDGLANGVVVDPGMLARFDVVPVYAAPLQTTDRWLTLLGTEATTVAQGYATAVQIDFYATSKTGPDTLPLKAWVNVLTGDHFYAPEGVPPPYACYVEQPEVQLGRVLKTGQGAFDVHLYLNEAGMTQIVGQAQAASMDLLAQGYLDMGAMFASAPHPESLLPSLVGIVSGV